MTSSSSMFPECPGILRQKPFSMRTSKAGILITLLTGLLFNNLLAQNNLAGLLQRGISNYPGIKARSSESESTLREVAAAKLEYMPKISLQHQYTYATSNSLAGSFYPNPAVISPSGSIRNGNIDQAAWGSYTSALVEWNVFNFGKVSGNVRASQKLNDASSANLESVIFQHKVIISDVYLLTLMHQRLTFLQGVNLQRANAFLDVVRAGVKAGIRPGTDSSLASAEAAKAKILLLQAEGEYQTQSLRLKELSGIGAHEAIYIDSTFLTVIPPRLDTGYWNSQLNPLLRYYRLKTEASQARSIATKRSYLPAITLVGAAWARGSGISADDSYQSGFSSGTKYQVHNYLLGISTRWTISDFAATRQRYKSEYYMAVQDQELLNEQDLRIKRLINESEMQYQISIEQIKTAPVQWQAAHDAYRQAFARYESGLTDLPTFMQSIVTLNRAEADMAIGYVNVWRSVLAIAAAKGDFSIFMNAVTR